MRVLVFTNMYPTPARPFYGSFVHDEVQALRDAGVQADVLFVDGRSNKLNYLGMPAEFFGRLRSRQYDAVHVHHSYCALIATAQSKVPVIWTCHEGATAALPEDVRADHWSKRLAYSSRLKRNVARRVEALITVNRSLGDSLGRPDAVVIPSGVDLGKFVPMDTNAARRRLGLPMHKRYILFPSSPSRPEKRHELARRAIQELKTAWADARDVELIALHNVPHDDVPWFINAADVVLMTSAFEGSPITVREALACNVPVVSTAVGDVPSLLEGMAGCAITDDNPEAIARALRAVLTFPGRTQSRAAMARYSVLRQVSAVTQVYHDVVARRRRRQTIAFVRHCYYAPHELKVQREAESLQQTGYRARVICLRNRGEKAREVVNGVEVNRLRLRHRRGNILRYLLEYNTFFAMASLKLIAWHLRDGLRAVQVHTMPDYLVFCALIPKLAGARVVLHLHEPMPELFGAIFKQWYAKPMVRLVSLAQRASIGFADRANTVTKEMRATFGKRGSNMEKIAVVLNVPDDKLFRLSEYEHLRRKALEQREAERPRSFRVFTHGAVEERYGLDTVVRAVAALRGEVPPFEFRFAGKGDHVDAVLALARQLGVANRVHYIGFVPFENMIEEIMAADVCVVSMKKNPYSDLVHTNKMFEYIALRRPVVASRLESTASYFPDDCLVYFSSEDAADLAEKLHYVSTHPHEIAARVDAASQRYETYRWENERRKYLGVYEDLLGVRLVAAHTSDPQIAPLPDAGVENHVEVEREPSARAASGR